MSSMSEPSAITGLPAPQVATQAVGNAGDAALDLEAVLLEDAGEVARGLEFLKAELAETEDRVHHDLRLLLHGIDLPHGVGLHGRFLLRGDTGLRPGAAEGNEKRESQFHRARRLLHDITSNLSFGLSHNCLFGLAANMSLPRWV